MNDLRTAAQQALEAMRRAVPTGKITLYEWDRAISDLSAALAQQAEPHESSDFDRWWDNTLDGPPPDRPVSKETARWIWDAALAQQAEPVALKHRHEWFHTGGMEPGQFRCIHCGVWGQEQVDPQIANRLARHGIPMPEGDPK